MPETKSALSSFVNKLPVLRQIQEKKFAKSFAAGELGGACVGVFSSRAQAVAAAPDTLPLGYDNRGAASLYRERLDQIYPCDYAPMFWLQKFFGQGARRLFELGGHVGVGYYAYQKHMDFPADVSWTICDVPAVVQSGRDLARVRDSRGALRFTEEFKDGSGADLLFTSGCVQYLEDTLAQRVASLPQKPRWIIINLLPLHTQEAFWTVQSIGRAFCAYSVQRDSDFFGAMTGLGYELLDRWENLDKSSEIHNDPAHSLDRYHGAAFRLK